MDSVPGQTFLNYAYSWGASIVILGTLFKLTHLPFADIMLFIGMGTEVLVFFISAFDRPFDKTADGRDIPTHVSEEYLTTGKVVYSNAEKGVAKGNASGKDGEDNVRVAAAVSGPQTIVFNSGASHVSASNSGSINSKGGKDILHTDVSASIMSAEQENVSDGKLVSPQGEGIQPNYVPQMSVEEAQTLNEAQGNYVDELKKLVETLSKVNEQSARLTRDSEEMENLNRTLTGISKVYEMQLKGASQQIGTIDQINEQTRRMAQQIEQLNKIYARMIEAMTVNMRAAAPGAAPTKVEG